MVRRAVCLQISAENEKGLTGEPVSKETAMETDVRIDVVEGIAVTCGVCSNDKKNKAMSIMMADDYPIMQGELSVFSIRWNLNSLSVCRTA